MWCGVLVGGVLVGGGCESVSEKRGEGGRWEGVGVGEGTSREEGGKR